MKKGASKANVEGDAMNEFYEYEAHIFFDDAIDLVSDESGQSEPNRFVQNFLSIIEEAAS
jgi:chitin synthase